MNMDSNDELKEIDIKNTCCYFDYIIKIEDFDLNNISIDEKSNENILVYNISYKILIDRFIRVYDGTTQPARNIPGTFVKSSLNIAMLRASSEHLVKILKEKKVWFDDNKCSSFSKFQ